MNDIIELLATVLVESIPVNTNWVAAKLHIKRLPGNVGFNSHVVTSSDELIHLETRMRYEHAKAIHKLYDLTQNHSLEHVNWNRAILKVTPDLKFNMEYIWDQELQNQLDSYS